METALHPETIPPPRRDKGIAPSVAKAVSEHLIPMPRHKRRAPKVNPNAISVQEQALLDAASARAALVRALNLRGMSVPELAEAAGLVRPNVLWNFINGTSSSLSQVVLTRCAAVLGVNASVLAGQPEIEDADQLNALMRSFLAGGVPTLNRLLLARVAKQLVPPPSLPGARPLPIGMVLPDGLDHPSPVLADAMPKHYAAPYAAPEDIEQGVFGVLLKNGAGAAYPPDTVLVCLKLGKYLGVRSLTHGRRVILRQAEDDGFPEHSVWELEFSGATLGATRSGQARLLPLGSDAAPIDIPGTPGYSTWTVGRRRYKLRALVTMACIPEGPTCASTS